MTTRAAKRRAVGEIEWVMDKLKTHALMATGRPVTNATLRLLPSAEQCTQLADRLGAALADLGHARIERGTRSVQRVDGGTVSRCPECGCEEPGHKIKCQTGIDRATKYQRALAKRHASERRRSSIDKLSEPAKGDVQ